MSLVANEAPERAIDHIASLDAEAAARLAPTLADSFARRDPESGIAWIEGLEEGPVQVAAARAFAKGSTYDTYALSEWARTLEPGATRDAVASELSNAVARREPESAFEWALVIGDQEARTTALNAAVGGWRTDNPEAATEAIQSNPELSEAERLSLLKILNPEGTTE